MLEPGKAAGDRWRYINGAHLVALVRAGARLRRGVSVESELREEEVAAARGVRCPSTWHGRPALTPTGDAVAAALVDSMEAELAARKARAQAADGDYPAVWRERLGTDHLVLKPTAAEVARLRWASRPLLEATPRAARSSRAADAASPVAIPMATAAAGRLVLAPEAERHPGTVWAMLVCGVGRLAAAVAIPVTFATGVLSLPLLAVVAGVLGALRGA